MLIRVPTSALTHRFVALLTCLLLEKRSTTGIRCARSPIRTARQLSRISTPLPTRSSNFRRRRSFCCAEKSPLPDLFAVILSATHSEDPCTWGHPEPSEGPIYLPCRHSYEENARIRKAEVQASAFPLHFRTGLAAGLEQTRYSELMFVRNSLFDLAF